MKLFHFLILLYCFILCFRIGWSQSYEIKWGNLEKKNNYLMSILPKDSAEFYALRRTGNGFFSSLIITKHTNNVLSGRGKISLSANESMANFEGATSIADKLVVFLSDREQDKNFLYLQQYDENINPKGKAIKMGEYTIPSGRSRGSFDIVESIDRNYFGVVWEIVGKKESKTTYGFHIYDKDFVTISEGEYTLPYKADLSTIYSHYLSNTGDYFISVVEYKEAEDKKLFDSSLSFKAFHILHVTPESLDDYTLKLNGKRVEAITMQSDNDHLFTITGIYGEENNTGATGVFFMRTDFNQKTVIDEGFEKFGNEFITQDWTTREKEKAAKREAKGKGEPVLYRYQMRDASVLEDGSIVASMEQYYVRINTYRDPRTGASSSSYTYYFNDIITYKVGANGSFDWLKKINKEQISNNDGGPYSSYARFIDQGQLCFIFNDNEKNYNENGSFKKEELLSPIHFNKRSNTVAIVRINLETGEEVRETFFSAQDITALALPKLFTIDYVTKQMILYAVYGKKEKFGTLVFRD